MPPLSASAALPFLSLAWTDLNRTVFRGALRPPVFALSEALSRYGRWMPRDRTIEISRRAIEALPWLEVVEVLKHEMAHQYVSEVLKIEDEAAHGPAFRAVCARLGVAPADSVPLGREPESDAHAKLVARIRRLLALGTSPNEHEAQAAARAAHRLMRRHNVSMAETNTCREYGFRQLGTPMPRVPGHVRILAGLLCEHFFVRAIWVPAFDAATGRRGRVLEISGTWENLEMASYVHEFVLRTAERLWSAWRGGARRPGTERSRFLVGVAVGFREQVEAQARGCVEEGLIWIGDAGLDDYVQARHPRLRTSRRVRTYLTPAYHDGREAGRKISLKRPIGESPAVRGLRLTDGNGS